MIPLTNPDMGNLLSFGTRWCCIGVVIQSLEVLRNFKDLRDPGLLGWMRSGGPGGGFARRGIQFANRYPAVAIILALRAIAAGAIFLDLGAAMKFGVLAFLVMAQLYYNRRFTMLAGNSETMFLVCLVGYWAASLPGGSVLLRSVALMFIAGQILLAYFVAGLNKLISPAWRLGRQMRQIVAGSSYQVPTILVRVCTRRMIARSLCWTVILLQLLFPASVVLPGGFFWFFLTAGLLFHTGVAVIMGLHGFWWSFIAAYPALYFVHVQIHSLLY